MKIWNKILCVSSTTIVMIVLGIISSTMLIASIMQSGVQEGAYKMQEEKDSTTQWIPTKEDIAYQDSMFYIVDQTSRDMDTIKEAIDRILFKLERLEYADGSSDSIRYEEGSAIDRRRNYPDEERMWVSGDGDTIWE